MCLNSIFLDVFPSVVAIVAIIVPAVQSIQNRKIEAREKQQERVFSLWLDAYVDFCNSFAEYTRGKADAIIRFVQASYKLAGLCNENEYNSFISLAQLVTENQISETPIDEEMEFENCTKIVRKYLTRKEMQCSPKNLHK